MKKNNLNLTVAMGILGFIVLTIASLILFLAIASIPGALFWCIWTWGGIGVKYFSFLPVVWQSIPIVYCIIISWLIMLLKGLLFGGISINKKS
jgi:hypothetical protein